MTDSNPLTQLGPYKWIGTEVGFGLVTGWCVGFAARKITYLVAFVLGVIFIAMQLMVSQNLITINWAGVQSFVQHNTPNVNGLWGILVGNFPYAGSFAIGFVAGFRKA